MGGSSGRGYDEVTNALRHLSVQIKTYITNCVWGYDSQYP